MKNSIKYLGIGAIMLGLAYVPFKASAIDQDVGATSIFRQAVTFTNVTNMDFGTVDYSGAGVGTVTLDANGGGTTCTGASYTCGGTTAAGNARVNGTTGMTVDLSCETAGVVTDGTNNLTLDTTEIRIGGTDTACAGLGSSPVAHAISGTVTNNDIKVGGVIQIPAGGIAAAGTYTASGANAIAVRAVYQ